MGRYVANGIHATLAKHKSWTAIEADNLMTLRDFEKLEWPEIADELGRSVYSCMVRYQLMGGRVDFQGRPDQKKTTERHEKVFAERDARLAAISQRNEAMAARGDFSFLVGDLPPPGRSALDQKRRAAP